VPSPTEVVLTSCVISDKEAPWVEYDTTTGITKPTSMQPDMFLPYLLTIVLEESKGAQWLINSMTQNPRKTCS
jgi:hypothetical protein